MALFPIELPPGVYRSGTELQSKGRYWDSDLTRWQNRALQPIGGWRQRGAESVVGVARSILPWTDNSGSAWIAIGTHRRLQVMDRGGTLYDITPIRATEALTDPFTTVDASAVVSVADTAHGATTGDEVTYSGAVAVGGITIDGTYTLTVVDGNNYTITHTAAATSSVAGGGGAVTAKYKISPGIADSDFRGGYGNDNYGEGTYGTPRSDSAEPNDVSYWSLDTFGQYLVAVRSDHGVLYEWQLVGATAAQPILNAPTARALVVTAERILMALGANGNPRAVAWSDQEDNTVWISTATNYAGDFNLQTAGTLKAGRRVRGGTLLLTDADVWLAEPTRDVFIYGFAQKGGAGTGIIAAGAVTTMDGEAVPASAVWEGQQGFFAYNGFVQPLECEIAGLVFTDINRTQASKVSAFHNADFGEVWFAYPSGSSTEVDIVGVWNYRENWWGLHHSVIRTCGTEKGPFAHPLAVSVAGVIYEHEVGLDYDGAEPYAETGPFVIGQGDRVVQVLNIIPDEAVLGDVDATFYLRFQPNGPETTYGPKTLTARTNARFTAREFRVRFTGARLAPWRVGSFQLDGNLRGRR